MIHLANLAKRYGGQELFSGVSLQLPDEAVVGLVGPNGAGKSTLFRIIAGSETADEGDVRTPKGTRIGWLTQDIENAGAGSVLETVLAGYSDILDMEGHMAELARRAEDPNQTDAALRDMAELQARFDAADGFRLEERARTILAGLGFDPAVVDGPYATLSGGWRMRAVLARLLLEEPDVLLLDEPTNHLDIDAIIWLEDFLADYPGLVVLISHDRELLDRATTWTLAIFDGRVRLFRGNYTAFEEASEVERSQLEAAAEQQARQRRETERFIERFRAKATKARQAQSRIKQLEKQEVIEAPSRKRKRMAIRLTPPNAAPRVLIECSDVHKSFGETRVFTGFDWRMQRGEKVAVVGPNGVGKTTFLRLIAGQIEADRGEIRIAPRAEAAYFAQHHLEALDPTRTVLETMLGMHPDVPHKEVRALLGAFLFSGDLVDKKVEVLSGGERARLSLARIFLRPRNLLLLDEPTNHLDMESREVVAAALAAYEGSLVVVSHDRSFLNGFVNHVVALQPGEFRTYPGNLEAYEWRLGQGEIEEAPPESDTPPAPKAKPKPPPAQSSRGEFSEGDLWKARKELRNRYRVVTRRIAELESDIAELGRKLADPALASDHEALWNSQRDLDQARNDLDGQMRQWAELAEKGEALGIDLVAELDSES